MHNHNQVRSSTGGILGIVIIVVALALAALTMISHRFEITQQEIDTNVAKFLTTRAATQTARSEQLENREQRCAEELSKAACLTVKDSVLDAMVIESLKVTLGEDLARIEATIRGEYRKRSIRASITAIGEPVFRGGSIYFKASSFKVKIDRGADNATTPTRRERLMSGLGKIFKVEQEKWDDLVGIATEKLDEYFQKGAERIAISALEKIPVKKLEARANDPLWKKVAFTIGNISIASTSIEDHKLVVVVSGAALVKTLLLIAAVVGLAILFASMGIFF